LSAAPDPAAVHAPAPGAARKIAPLTLAVAAGVLVATAGLLALASFFWPVVRPALHKDIINRYAAVYKIDPLFVMALVKVESGFMRDARSPRGAVGLMQLMPDTGLEMAQRAGLKIAPTDLDVPEINIHLGVHYLSVLRLEFKEDVTALLAAYNAGPKNVRSWKKGDRLDLEEIPYPETRQFVRRVISTHVWLRRFRKVKNVFS
jgi:soluble lytic murein transglycosylase